MTISAFKKMVWSHYKNEGRMLPWRTTYNPYHVLVSEIMLQQTQVDRVIPYFNRWIKAFPTPHALNKAPLKKVLTYWQGLGYNRRGLNLKRAAEKIENDFKGIVPNTTEELLSLPGIGPYTAAAIQAFAFNLPSIVIETNIRTVFIHHFFPRARKISDEKLKPLIQQSLDLKKPREWYSALMDYGSKLKQEVGNTSRKSKHYVRQSPFTGSTREERSKILKAILQSPLDRTSLMKNTGLSANTLKKHLHTMSREGLLKVSRDLISIEN